MRCSPYCAGFVPYEDVLHTLLSVHTASAMSIVARRFVLLNSIAGCGAFWALRLKPRAPCSFTR